MFGRNPQTDPNHIDFSLPDVPSGLPGTPADNFRFFFGPPKLGHKHWLGSLYPARLREEHHFTEVIKHFNFLELNRSFYADLKPEHISRWTDAWSKNTDFRVSPKFFRSITHFKRLIEVEQETESFVELCRLFGSNLGPSLMQLKENWGPENMKLLENYLQILPADISTHVELRHPGWFEKQVFESITDLFKRHQIGTVLTDTNDRRDMLHMTLTTKKAYIRFTGNNNHPSDKERLEAWAAKILQWKDEGVDEVYFSLHQPFEETFSESVAIAKDVFKDLLPRNMMLNTSGA